MRNSFCCTVFPVLLFFTGCAIQNVKYFHRQAVSHEVDGDWKNAEKSYNELLKLDEQYFPAVYNLGNVYFQLKNYKKSRVQFVKAIQLKTNFAPAYYNLAVTYVHLGEYQLAFKAFEVFNRVSPEDISGWVDHAVVHYMDGKAEKAQNVLQKGLVKNPSNFQLLFNSGLIYWKEDNADKAMKRFVQAYKLNPQSEINSVMLVKCAVALSNVKAAGKYLTVLQKQRPDSKYTLIEAARLAFLENKTALANKKTDKVLDDYPDFSEALALKAACYLRLKKVKEALEYQKRAVAADPADIKNRLKYAEILTLSGRYTQARLELVTVKKAYPENKKVISNLLMIYYKQGYYDKTITTGQELLKLDSKSKVARYYLGISYIKTDDRSLRDPKKSVQLLWPLRKEYKHDRVMLKYLRSALEEQKLNNKAAEINNMLLKK